VLRHQFLRGLWMSFLAYNSARAGLVLLLRRCEGAQLCLAQTRGLLERFPGGSTGCTAALAVAGAKLPSLHPVKDFPQFKSGGAHSFMTIASHTETSTWRGAESSAYIDARAGSIWAEATPGPRCS